MRNLWTIIKKELKRFFTDKRMLVSLVLPGLMIFLLYSIMGSVITSNLGQSEDQVYSLKVDYEPAGFSDALGEIYHLDYQNDLTEDEALTMVTNKELDLYVVFPSDFMDEYNAGNKPNIVMNYNGASSTSSTIAEIYSSFLSASLQGYTVETNNQATDLDISVQIITGLIPFLLITFLYTGVMAVAPESIAGEKERGTIASLLITPVKRSTIALGKIIALSITGLASATSSFIGLMVSLPKLAGTDSGFDLSIYGVGTYLLVFLVIISTVLVFTVLISLISTYAKSIKEASSFAMPLMIIVMLVGVSTMMGTASNNTALYLIPVYNSTNALLSIFSLQVDYLNLAITIISNLLITGLGVFVLTRMFNSEKIMFRK
ncbi:MAG: ABC transporter permease [Bacilli bacterium]|jgi:sodium transport system permease protein|nr:ABC transporter permease [Bacilli bacterium]MCH4201986.1 ABC transporter permease [Bacilli bacterium]